MEAQPKEIKNYITADGREPFAVWLDSMRDLRAKVKIEKRLQQTAENLLQCG
ncbi:hypothetical protein [Brasilonema sennae]|uniref:hypothetical protein n=1 Tax=Brasilonema sennae TaxID=1397703 RepID=UPI001554065C|nr:hypothetical protein [Brasilonema sennae]